VIGLQTGEPRQREAAAFALIASRNGPARRCQEHGEQDNGWQAAAKEACDSIRCGGRAPPQMRCATNALSCSVHLIEKSRNCPACTGRRRDGGQYRRRRVKED
jgi:hypothetical protein